MAQTDTCIFHPIAGDAMPIINKVSPAVFDAKPNGRHPSPEMLVMIERIKSIRSEKDVYEVLLTGDEEAATIRQQLGRAARAAGVDLAVRRSAHGFYIRLNTPERAGRRHVVDPTAVS